MDPVSQGALGAVFSQTTQTREKIVVAAWLGCAAGMAPDLDVLIQSSTDPLLFLEYHRHFTHALIFIPIGAAIVCGALYRLAQHRLTLQQAYLACLIGYATHGLLDACTSYGTQLFWPFSDTRVDWNNVSVVDPMLTLPLLACAIAATRLRRRRLAYLGIGWVLAYLSLGVVQLYRAEASAEVLAGERGHEANRLTLKPSFGNLVVWKSIYEYQNHYYVDGIRVFAGAEVCEGNRVEKLDPARHLPFLEPDSQQHRDLERFRWFSDDYLSPTEEPGGVTDIRYSMVANQTRPMWGITLSPQATREQHVAWWSVRDAGAARRSEFYALLVGEGCRTLH